MCTVISRFGLRRDQNIRAIDDFSAIPVNACYESLERVVFQGIDSIAALLQQTIAALKDDRAVVIKLQSGGTLHGDLHQSSSLETARYCVSRLLDLEAAHKTLLVSRKSTWASVLRTYYVGKQMQKLYISQVLVFGASAPVYGLS